MEEGEEGVAGKRARAVRERKEGRGGVPLAGLDDYQAQVGWASLEPEEVNREKPSAFLKKCSRQRKEKRREKRL